MVVHLELQKKQNEKTKKYRSVEAGGMNCKTKPTKMKFRYFFFSLCKKTALYKPEGMVPNT